MAELQVTATEMRAFLKDFANMVASGGGSIVMSRHGMKMAVLVSYQEYQEFLRFRAPKAPPPRRPPPDGVPLPELRRMLDETENIDDDETLDWRGKAFISLYSRSRFGTGPPS